MTEMGYSPRVSSSLGAAAMLAAWLLTGTRRSNEARFWESFEACGAELGVLPGHNSFLISLSAPRRRFKRAAELLAEVLREPRFGLAEFEREREHLIENGRCRENTPNDAALHRARAALFGSPVGNSGGRSAHSTLAKSASFISSASAGRQSPPNAAVILAWHSIER